MPRQDPEAEPIDFAHRVLCPDGACLGLVGDDGRCKVCGRAGAKSGPGPFRSKSVDTPDPDDTGDDDPSAVAAPAQPAAEPSEPADDAESAEPAAKTKPAAKAKPAAKTKAAAADDDSGAPDDWDNRLLCPDGACLGVIKANGKCSICGQQGS